MTWVIRGSNLRRVHLSLLQNIQGGSEAHPVSYSMGTKGSLSGHETPTIVGLSFHPLVPLRRLGLQRQNFLRDLPSAKAIYRRKMGGSL
jgi:hypothetical protein